MLNLKNLGFLLCLASFISLGCESSNTQRGTGPTAPIMVDNSNSASPWAGSYKGVIPCADCSGIATEVTLFEDQSYSWGYKYLGKSDDIVEFKGFFEWDAQGKIVVFKDANSGDILNRFKLEENSLRMLDKEGKIIEGDLIRSGHQFPSRKPDLNSLPIRFVLQGMSLDVGHWADGSGRDTFKLYSGNRSALGIMRSMLGSTEMLGANQILAIDYDPWCIENTQENLQTNDCKKITVLQADHCPELIEPVDIILANINLNVIQDNLIAIVKSTKMGGKILFSGVLDHDKELLQSSIEKAGLQVTQVKSFKTNRS
jgi:uncharacterized lipoprotein NlpE involved in copper resistance